MDNMNTQELVSALADGQLKGEALAQGLHAALSDPEALRAWQAYHLIGDVLRSRELAQATPPAKFLAGLQEKLRGERPLAAAAPPRESAPMPPVRVLEPRREILARAAANDSGGRWKLVAGFASLAAAGAVGWAVLGAGGGATVQPQLAAAPGPAGVAAAPGGGAMLRDPHLDQLLAAHRQLGGATALQAPAGFLRNATFEGPAR